MESGMIARWTFLVGLGVLGWPALIGAGEWPQFRGAGGAGVSTESPLPEQWSTTQHVAWKVKLPGYGWSSPIVWGDKVFVTTAVSPKQPKPSEGLGGGFGGPSGFGDPPPGSSTVSPFVQQTLNLTAGQVKQLEDLHKEVDAKLGQLLTAEQAKEFKESQEGFGRGGFAGRPQPGQILQIMGPALQEKLKLTANQKKELGDLQKTLDDKLGKLLTDEQKKTIAEMRANRRRGERGGLNRPQKAPDAVYQWEVYCLHAGDGKVLWKQTAAEGKPTLPAHPSNTYATETPVTDGERVYVYFGMTGVFCYDLDGKLQWKANLGSYRMAMGYGTASSPVLADGRLFIQCDNEEKSFLVALDAKTGKELWRVVRPEHSSWSTPLVWKNKVRTEVVCLGSPRVRSYDPATGKQLWDVGDLDGQAYASMVAGDELLYVGISGGISGVENGHRPAPTEPVGGVRPLFAVRAGAAGSMTLKDQATPPAGIAWRLPQGGPSIASPLLYQGYLYVLEQRGTILSCYDATTGKRLYKQRLPGGQGITSSPWGYAGKVFCLDNGGTTHVIQAGPVFKVLGRNSLEEMCWSSPAAAGGALFLRTVDHLYCIRP
jgi:outer membrane protein assembly factor BamB